MSARSIGIVTSLGRASGARTVFTPESPGGGGGVIDFGERAGGPAGFAPFGAGPIGFFAAAFGGGGATDFGAAGFAPFGPGGGGGTDFGAAGAAVSGARPIGFAAATRRTVC